MLSADEDTADKDKSLGRRSRTPAGPGGRVSFQNSGKPIDLLKGEHRTEGFAEH